MHIFMKSVHSFNQEELLKVQEKQRVESDKEIVKKRIGTGSVISRGIGYVRKMKWNNEEEIFHRRLSQPDMESGHAFAQFNTSWSAQNTPRASMDMTDDNKHMLVLPSIQEMQDNRALHTPTRYLPQNQAIITTNSDGTILLFNDIASLCFDIDKSFVGKPFITTCLGDPFKDQITTVLDCRKKTVDGCTQKVIVCGKVIPIHKRNGIESVASLWLKEKVTENSDKIYIWIFEEIFETTLSVYVNSDCKIQRVLGTMIEIYGYQENDIIGKPVNCLVPALSKEQRDDNLEKIDRLKFFGSLSSKGDYFPVILNLNRHVAIGNDDFATFVVKITSLPSISGSVTFDRSTGLIHELSAVSAKYLFGYSVNMIVNKMNIHDIIPQVPIILSKLSKTQIAKNELCKKLLEDGEDAFIYVHHRDGSKFAVEIELKMIENNLVSVSIAYDRLDAASKHEKRKDNMRNQALPSQDKEKVSLPAEATKQKRPVVRPFRISSFGAVDEAKRLFPTNHTMVTSNKSPTPLGKKSSPPTESVQKKKHPLDDYVILDVLGQGTYGTAKLAYRKDDPTQKKLVIKYIIKSKIIVDSWIRDRQLGSIPMEIHILRTLQKHPHINCCRLVTSMEDDDCYFVVMDLLGNGMDLFDYIEINKSMTENEIRHIFYQVTTAVKHLHTNKIVHRDIKDENVILDQKGTVNLIDFGCAAYYKEGRNFDTFTGTLEYCAPEVLKGMPYEGPQQDIWACGVLLFTLFYRENPFYNIDEIVESELRIPFVVSKESIDLIKKMLNRNVDERIDIDQVLEHPWFHSISE